MVLWLFLVLATCAHAAPSCKPTIARGRLLNVSVATDEPGPYISRPVLVYVPALSPGMDSERVPALLTLHGFGSSPSSNLEQTGLVVAADDGGGIAQEYGWVVAAPYGSAPGVPTGCSSPAAPCAWNAGGWSTAAAANRSDVAFLSRVAKWLGEHACVDPAAVYATGFSNGAMMANRLACEAPTAFRGAAPMSGSVVLGGAGDFAACAPRTVLHGWLSFCGNDDGVCMDPQYGSLGEAAAFALFGSKCGGAPRPTYVTPTTRCEEYFDCPGGGLVEHCLVLGMGHQISGHPARAATDVDAVRYALNRLSLTLANVSINSSHGASHARSVHPTRVA